MKITLEKLNIVLLIGVAILLSACGGDTIKERTITASDIAVSGNGSKYIRVVDGDYIMKTVDSKVIIPIKIELIKSVEIDNAKMGNLTLIPIDNSGAAVPDIGLDFSPATMSDWGKVENLLSGDVGQVSTISFEWSYFSKKDKQARIMKETENFEITRADITSESSAAASNTNFGTDENESTEESNSKLSKKAANKIDRMLDDYEKYVLSYIEFASSIKDEGDELEKWDDLYKIYDKALDFEEQFDDIDEKDMSANQMKRFLKINNNLIEASIDMAY